MKKMISAALLAIIIAATTSGYATAQTGDKDIAFIPAKNHAAYVSFITKSNAAESTAIAAADTLASTATTAKASKAEMKAIKANGKALKNFNSMYRKDMPDAKWSTLKDGMVAYFSKDDVKTNVVYTKKGSWLHTLTYYPANKTPKDVVDIIDYAYPKDNITLTVKVEEGSMVFYIVQLENKTTLRKVTVYNGEVNQIEELTKAN